MRLSKIKLAGFKSFVDPTTIHFPSNLIGIVGPNGCGKSNVIDAVRWVMGESSAKQLRGDSMADVIFNGSTARKPVGHATIELVFDNSDGKVGGQYANYNEIAIKRQVSRDGQSSYFLNGTRCRRRDITDIFLGTGLGPRSYAIIEQGMISRLIEARPEELRIFLEEAAGISKYKERRKETESRMQNTKENLSRLNDLRDEVEKQLQHLQRQAKTAEKFKELKQEERQARAELLALRCRALDAAMADEDRHIRETETRLEAAVAEQRAAEAAMEKAHAEHTDASETFSGVQARFYSVGAEIARIEQAIQHARETRQRQQQDLEQTQAQLRELRQHIELDVGRLDELAQSLSENEPALEQARAAETAAAEALADAERAMHDWQTAWEEFNRRAAEPAQTSQVERTRMDQLERHLQQLQQRHARLGDELQALNAHGLDAEIETLKREEGELHAQFTQRQAALDELLQEIKDLRERSHTQTGEVDAARARLQDARGRLVSLDALQQASLGKNPGAVTDWLRGRNLADAPRLAQRLRVAPEWERAVETVLGFYLEAVCVDGMDAVAGVLSELAHGSLALFDTRAPAPSASAASAGTPLAAQVESEVPLGSLLDGVYAADNLAEALALRPRLAAHESVITRDGVWLGGAWLRVARDADEKAGVLAREKEIKQLNSEVEKLQKDVEARQQALEETRNRLRESEAQRETVQTEVNSAHRRHSEAKAQWSTRQVRLEQLQLRAQANRDEDAELEAQMAREQDEILQARTRLHQALELMESLAGERDRLSTERDGLRAALDAARTQARQERERSHETALRVESMRTARASIDQGLERMRGQLGGLEERQAQLRTDLESAQAPLQALDADLEQKLAGRMAVETELAAARRHMEEIDEAFRGHEQQRVASERKAQDIRSELEQVRLATSESRVRRQTLGEQVAETGFELPQLFEMLPEGADESQWAENVERLAQRIQRLGPINLAAIDEFAEQSERKTYLDAQHADLTEALETLENAIRKIDRETRARFQETFDKVNSGLQAMFPRLFGGGHAYLELTGEDLLDTGVSVMARPPGKRISTIHLMSGGEKALTAVALVFAIFELNPSPFCMLDEVDAPLDDANVGRFCDMVREMSDRVQFIYITHNKTTMEMAHQLSGVTMHEAGVSRLVAVDVDEAVQLAAV